MRLEYEKAVLVSMMLTIVGAWVYCIVERVLFFCFHYPGVEVIVVFYKMIRRDILFGLL